MEAALIIALVEGVINEVPAALDAYDRIRGVAASGGTVSVELMEDMIAKIRATNTAIQQL